MAWEGSNNCTPMLTANPIIDARDQLNAAGKNREFIIGSALLWLGLYDVRASSW